MNTLYFLEEWRGEQRISPPGDNFTPRGQNSLLEIPGSNPHQGQGFTFLYIAVLLSKLDMQCHCVSLRKINALTTNKQLVRIYDFTGRVGL
jgi:hypothetical protein